MSQEAIAYLNEALDLLEQHSVERTAIDWERLRNDLLTRASHTQTIPDTYPLIQMALARLGDRHSFFVPPDEISRFEEGIFHNIGILAVYPEGTIVRVYEGSPAEQAGVRVADVLEAINHTELAMMGAEAFKNALETSTTVTLTLKGADHEQPSVVTVEAASYPLVANPQGRWLAQEIGYLDLPGMVGSEEMLSAYTATLHDLIRELDQVPPRGWVVDLRRDTGGNMFPMLTGVGPILGEGELGAFVDPAGETMFWSYRHGQLCIGDWAGVKHADPYPLKQPHGPVAVLTSRLTASSGELVLLAFRGRPHTRTFGEETAGLPTANQGMQLSDGAIIQLTIALGADRTGQTYDGPVAPDEYVEADWTQLGTQRDPVLAAAVAWILEAPS